MPEIVNWFLTPAVDPPLRTQATGATVVRLLLGVMWAYNVAWKVPPEFGALASFTSDAVSHPVFPPYSYVVEHLVLPHIVVFGFFVVVAEVALAVTLLTGAYVRVAALLGIAQSLAIGLSVAKAPGEWPWSYILMVAAHLMLLVSSSGRFLAVDAVRAGLSDGRGLARFWAVVAVVIGLVSTVRALGAPLAERGPQFESAGLMVGLGAYNVVGGLLLAVLGVLLFLASTGRWGIGWVALVLGAVAAVSLAVQIGYGTPLLGGTANSASVYLSVALVGGAVAYLRTRGTATTRTAS